MHGDVDMGRLEDVPLTLATARGAVRLRSMLDRGFTAVRDTGGTDWGVKAAVEQGLIVGPRLFIAGRSIGPTGGHSDGRGDRKGGVEGKSVSVRVYPGGRRILKKKNTQ